MGERKGTGGKRVKRMKYLALIFLALIVLFLVMGGIVYLDMKTKEPPSIEDAPWAAQTYSQDGMMIPSRYYYVSEVDIIEGQPVISEYWAFDGERYKKSTEGKVLPANSRIIRRQQ